MKPYPTVAMYGDNDIQIAKMSNGRIRMTSADGIWVELDAHRWMGLARIAAYAFGVPPKSAKGKLS